MPRPHRCPDASEFSAREVIPAELRLLFGRKWASEASLGTSNPAAVKRLHTDALARFEAQIATGARRGA